MKDKREAFVDSVIEERDVALSVDEYAELARLVGAELKGEDVEYAAFSSLCPTMEEGKFDANACEVYRRLREAGMIEGESDDGGFYFVGLTPEGRELVARREEGQEGVFGAEWAQLAGQSAGLDGTSRQADISVGLNKPGLPVSGRGPCF